MSTGFTVGTNEHLIRTQLWQKQLKQLLLDDLCAMKFVRMVDGFTDGTTLNIPSVGEAESADFAENQTIKYNRMDTGNFQFEIDQYKYSANSVSEQFKQDSWYAQEVIASFVPKQHRALMEAIETRILSRLPGSQTPSNVNAINGANHRWVGSGTGESIALKDFAMAQHALTMANVPLTNLVAIVDPSVAYTLQTQTNLMNFLSPNQQWGSIVNTGAVTGMRFMFNVFGFDVYISNYLPKGLTDSIGGRSTANGVANQFFSAAGGDINPIIGTFRQHPTVYSEFSQDRQEERYLTICRYGFKTYRPENSVIVITDLDVVA